MKFKPALFAKSSFPSWRFFVLTPCVKVPTQRPCDAASVAKTLQYSKIAAFVCRWQLEPSSIVNTKTVQCHKHCKNTSKFTYRRSFVLITPTIFTPRPPNVFSLCAGLSKKICSNSYDVQAISLIPSTHPNR